MQPVEDAGVQQLLGRVAEQALRRRAGVDHRALRVAHHGEQLRALGEGAEAPLAGLQRQLGLVRARDVLDRAFVVQRRAVVGAHQAGVLADPDALARLVAKDLGDEVDHLAVALHQVLEFDAPLRVHVPLAADVVDGRQQLAFAVVAVQPHQRGVGAQLPACDAGAVGPDRQQFEQRRAAGRCPWLSRCGGAAPVDRGVAGAPGRARRPRAAPAPAAPAARRRPRP